MITKTKLKNFESWLSSQGCEILPKTNEWEVLRFRSKLGVGVVYQKANGSLSVSSNFVNEAFDCFAYRRKWGGKGKPTKRTGGSKVKRQLLDRDGPDCFYCRQTFSSGDLTKEHLVPINKQGPDRLENLVLACKPCNLEAGHMSVVEKVNLRDSKRFSINKPLAFTGEEHF